MANEISGELVLEMTDTAEPPSPSGTNVRMFNLAGDVKVKTAAGVVTSMRSSFYSGRVSSAGTMLSTTNNCSVVRDGVGVYTITFPVDQVDANYPVLLTTERSAGGDDYLIVYEALTISDFAVCITEQDNGGTPGVPRDNDFSFFVPLHF